MSNTSKSILGRAPTAHPEARGRGGLRGEAVGREQTLPATATASIGHAATQEVTTIADEMLPAPAPGSLDASSPGARAHESTDVGMSADGATAGTGAGTDTGHQAIEALRRAEVARSKSFFQIILLFGPLIAGTVFLLPGENLARLLLVSAIVVFVVVSIPAYLNLRKDQPASDKRLAASGVSGVTAVYCGLYYFGPLSLASMVTVLGLYFFSMAGSPRTTRLVFFTAAIEHALLAALSVTETIPTVGLVRAFDMSAGQQLIVHVLAEIILLQTYVLSRASLKSQVQLVNQLEIAVREKAVARREAILEEAHQELHRAGMLTGEGRFTDQILGSFLLGSVIGRGAMGEVYAASRDGDTKGIEDFAVKVMVRAALSSPEHVKRFLREGELISQIRSPHVVPVYEIGGGDGRLPYIAMQRLRGKDLSTVLREQEHLPLSQCCELAEQVAKGLADAHALGIVHRDLKPLNIFRDGSGSHQTWKILDFGVARATDTGASLTGDKLVGTPAYMAPEQARSQEVDHRADVYALAAVLYRAVTGEAPFRGANTPEILLAVTTEMPKRPSSLRRLPTELDEFFAVALAKAPDRRFDSTLELSEAFQRATRRSRTTLGARASAILRETPWAGEATS